MCAFHRGSVVAIDHTPALPCPRLCAVGAPHAAVLLNPLVREKVACGSQTAAASSSFSLRCQSATAFILSCWLLCLLLRLCMLSLNVKHVT